MHISRDELGTMLGLEGHLVQGHVSTLMTSDGTRRAYVGFPERAIDIEVTDHASGQGETLMSLRGPYDRGTDSFDLDGVDVSGETSDPNDVRCIAASFRRYVLGMVAVE